MDPILYWKFEASLNEAIDRLIEHYRASHDTRLVHVAGLDCGGAVARLLYTTALNDEWLRQHFDRIVERQERPAWILAATDLADLTRELLSIWGAPKIRVIAVPTMRQIHRWAFHFPALIKAWCKIKVFISETDSVSRVANTKQSVDVICFAHHRKFVGLMRPVAVKTELEYAFLIRQEGEIDSLGLSNEEAILLPQLDSSVGWELGAAAWPDVANFALRVESLFLKCRPKILLYCEGDAWYQDIVSRLGDKHSIRSVCIQWGAFPYEKPRIGFRKLACSIFFSWGDFFVEQLKPYNKDTSFVAIGHPGIELKTPASVNKRITFLLNTDPNGKVTGLDYFHEQFWQLIMWTAMHADDWKLTVRAHPMIPLTLDERSILDRFRNIEVHDPLNTTLADSLTDCDLAVTVSSSSIIEAVAFGAVPLIFNPAPWRYQPDFGLYDSGFECKSVKTAIETMKMLIASPMNLQAAQKNLFCFRKRLFTNSGVTVQVNIANAIRKYLRSIPPQENAGVQTGVI